MDFYEFHYLVEDLLDYLKKENEANQGQKDQAGDMMSKMKMPNMSMPNFKMPKIG